MKPKSLIHIIYNIQKIIEEDKNHRVRLKEDYVVGTFKIPIPDFDCADFYMKDKEMIVKKEATCIDRATCAPDKFIIDMACGYIPHDVWYAHLEEMAANPDFQALVRPVWGFVFYRDNQWQLKRKRKCGAFWVRKKKFLLTTRIDL